MTFCIWSLCDLIYGFYLEHNKTKFRKEIPVAKTLEPGVLEFCGAVLFLLFLQTFLLDLQTFIGGRNLTVYDPLIWQTSNLGQFSGTGVCFVL